MAKSREPERPPEPEIKYRRWLPYWAVLQTDIRQTLRSWVYRLWVAMSVLGGLGYLLYRYGIHREAGIIQSASVHTSDVLRALVLGSLALIVVLTVSSISSERGTLADSILGRGISRYQYFMAKWHSRTFVVLGTFLLLAAFLLGGSMFLLSEDLTLAGSCVALSMVGVVLAAIVAWGVTIGALTNSTVLGITLFWLALYGAGVLMTLLPPHFPSPNRVMQRLPFVLQGQYDIAMLSELVVASTVMAFGAAAVGMIGFARKDV